MSAHRGAVLPATAANTVTKTVTATQGPGWHERASRSATRNSAVMLIGAQQGQPDGAPIVGFAGIGWPDPDLARERPNPRPCLRAGRSELRAARSRSGSRRAQRPLDGREPQ